MRLRSLPGLLGFGSSPPSRLPTSRQRGLSDGSRPSVAPRYRRACPYRRTPRLERRPSRFPMGFLLFGAQLYRYPCARPLRWRW